jgi:PadR family transcriptional regulator PadR
VAAVFASIGARASRTDSGLVGRRTSGTLQGHERLSHRSLLLCKALAVHDCGVEQQAASGQFLKGALDLCLLAVISAERTYGYALTQRLGADGLDVAPGSIYPALGRLRRAELVTVEERSGDASQVRTYYSLTAAGIDRLARLARSWEEFNASVGRLLHGTGALPARQEDR